MKRLMILFAMLGMAMSLGAPMAAAQPGRGYGPGYHHERFHHRHWRWRHHHRVPY